jgi:hypothetical protein
VLPRRGRIAVVEDVVVVPGFMPHWAREPRRLHPRAARRVDAAIDVGRREGIPWLLVSGGAVYPEGTPFVEADGMAMHALEQGWPAEQIAVERAARHTETNLRNCGRIMLQRGWTTARVVTDLGQWSYMVFEPLGFVATAESRLGAPLPWALQSVRPGQLRFWPTVGVDEPGPDPLDP